MIAPVVSFAALAEVRVTVLSLLNLPRQGFPATCPIEHCVFAAFCYLPQKCFVIRQAIRQRTVNHQDLISLESNGMRGKPCSFKLSINMPHFCGRSAETRETARIYFKLDKQTWRRKKQWYTEDDFSKSTH